MLERVAAAGLAIDHDLPAQYVGQVVVVGMPSVDPRLLGGAVLGRHVHDVDVDETRVLHRRREVGPLDHGWPGPDGEVPPPPAGRVLRRYRLRSRLGG